jgi:hypothetical protein
MKKENEISEELKNIEKENDNEFCLLSENKENNKKEAKNQIDNIVNQNNISFIKTNSYKNLNGKLTISLSKTEKKELVDKYWLITPEKKFDFYGKEIKNIYQNENVSGLKDLVGILMVFKNFLTEKDLKRFDNYFTILIKSNERNYLKPKKEIIMENDKKEGEEKYGKILYIGGILENYLGEMLRKEFNENSNQILPVYISIRTYKEFEEIEIDALDLCDKIPEHDGFVRYKNVFHPTFSKNLSNKIKRIKEGKNKKRQDLLELEQKNNI